MDLVVSAEYEALLPKLPTQEYEALKASIKNEGQHLPIVVNGKGVVLDGYHRLRVCKELGLKPKFTIRWFGNPLLEKKFVIESNLLRRQLTTFQRIEMGKPLLHIERELAKERMFKPHQNFDEGQVGQALDKFAEKIGSNRETVNEGLWLLENAPQGELDKLRTGERAISNLYKETKRLEHLTQPTHVEIPIASQGLTEKLFLTNVWSLPESRPKGYGSADFRGNCDPTIIDQCLRHYVLNPYVPNEVKIADPMAGSGTFVDVAKALGFSAEQVFAYDLTQKRDDVRECDARKLPHENESLSFIFCHYPYWNMWQYSEKPEDFSNCDYADFLSRIKESFKEYYRVLKANGYLCTLIGNKRANGIIDIEADVSQIGREIFGKIWDKIITVVGDAAGHAHTAHGEWGIVANRALRGKWTIQNYDTLLVFRKD